VKLKVDTIGNSVPASRTYNTSSNILKKSIVSQIEISEQVAKKMQYIIGIHPHDGRVVAVFKVKNHKKRYTKFKNKEGKYKYTFNFYAYTEKTTSINNIKLVKLEDTVLTNYKFEDQNEKKRKKKEIFKMKKHKKRYTKYKNKEGKYKYTFNFYAYTEKTTSINNIQLVKLEDTVLTNYRFVDQNGKMTKSTRATVFLEGKR